MDAHGRVVRKLSGKLRRRWGMEEEEENKTEIETFYCWKTSKTRFIQIGKTANN